MFHPDGIYMVTKGVGWRYDENVLIIRGWIGAR